MIDSSNEKLVKNEEAEVALETDYRQSNNPGEKNPTLAVGGINTIFYGAPGCGKSRYVSDLLERARVSKKDIIRGHT